MIVEEEISALRAHLRSHRQAGRRVGLVATMGALHQGHLSLVSEAKKTCDIVVGTIFVNPAQFNEEADFKNYPRNHDEDLTAFKQAGVDIVFIPDCAAIYPPKDETIVETVRLANIWHGKTRPGHFRGVTTVVARLFNIIQPDAAFFGEKDYQQLQIIRKMVRDLHIPVEIIALPTQRASDGLALSSRNMRLSPADRQAALVLSRALENAQKAPRPISVQALAERIQAEITAEKRAELHAIDIATPETLEPVFGVLDKPVVVMLSVAFSGILLIDQAIIAP